MFTPRQPNARPAIDDDRPFRTCRLRAREGQAIDADGADPEPTAPRDGDGASRAPDPSLPARRTPRGRWVR
jgi:hypothetical protein